MPTRTAYHALGIIVYLSASLEKNLAIPYMSRPYETKKGVKKKAKKSANQENMT